MNHGIIFYNHLHKTLWLQIKHWVSLQVSEQTQIPPRFLLPLALQLWRGQECTFLRAPIYWVITAPMTAVLTRKGHLSVSCLTSFRAQLERSLMSPGTVTCPQGLPVQLPSHPVFTLPGWEAHLPWLADRNWGPCAAAYMILPPAAHIKWGLQGSV